VLQVGHLLKIMYRVHCDTNLYYSELLFISFLSFDIYNLPLQIPYCFVLIHVDCDETSCGKKNLFPLFQQIELRRQFKRLLTLNFTRLYSNHVSPFIIGTPWM